MKKYLLSSKMVMDIGANIGEWTTLALQINPNASIHCFEPSQPTFEKLKENVPASVACNNFGLGSRNEQKEFFVFDNLATTNSLYERHGLEDGWGKKPQTKNEIVQIRTIDDYCQKNNIEKIDFLKIDTEGHELEVLKGAKQLLSNKVIKIIYFEYGGCYIDARILLKDIFEYIDEFSNYRIYKILPNAIQLIRRYDQRLENFQYANYAVIDKNII